MTDPIDYAYNNYMIHPVTNTMERNNNNTNSTPLDSNDINYGYDVPNSDMKQQSGQQQQQQPGHDIIHFNIHEQLQTTTASTTLLRPKQPGPLLPLDYEPSNLDICSGRGKRNWNHSANIAFRDLIQNATPIYMGTATKNEKTAIVCNIVEGLRAMGCQFLKLDTKTGRWYDMGDAQARDKVGHSLRDQVTAYHRSKISGAPTTMLPLTMENVIELTKHDAQLSDQHDVPSHVRRPSMALSDSGNEAEARRTSLATTAMHGEFARRPSWVASSGSTADAAVFHELDNETNSQQVESSDFVHKKTKIPRSQSVQQSGRLTSWEFLDTFDYYIENDIDLTQSNGTNSGGPAPTTQLRKTSSFEPIPVRSSSMVVSDESLNQYQPSGWVAPNTVVSDSLLSHYPLSGGVVPTAPMSKPYPARLHSNDNISRSILGHDQRKQSLTMDDIQVWDARMSNGQVDKMLHESVLSWDPRSSGANTSMVSVRRSAMAGGTTLRRLTNSFKPTDRSIDSILDGMDFGNSANSLSVVGEGSNYFE